MGGGLGMSALHSVIQKFHIHHLLTHLILIQILLADTNHTTKQVDQDTRSIGSIRKIEDLDHQALIVQYHLTVNIGNINKDSKILSTNITLLHNKQMIIPILDILNKETTDI